MTTADQTAGAAAPAVIRPVQAREPYPVAAATQSLGVFALAGASMGLFWATAFQLDRTTLAGFLERNVLPMTVRNVLFGSMLVGAAVLLLGALGYLIVRGRQGVPVLRTASEVILPLCMVGALPSLFVAKPWAHKPTTFLVGLAIFVLVLERAMRRSLTAFPESIASRLREVLTFRPAVRRWLPLGVVLLGSLGYSIYFSYYTILNHQRLGTAGFDLGINVSWCYNALQGSPFRSSVLFGPDGGNFIGGHAIFAMIFWLPLYALFPGAEVLLIFQATMVGFAGSTLYLFASTQIPRWSAVVVAYAFLLFAPLHGPNFYDYHELLPPLFFHFLLYWAIATNRNKLLWVLVPVLWMFREDISWGMTVLGVFLIATGLRPRLGAVLAVTSLIYFITLKFVIMPRLWNGWFASIYKDLQAPGDSGYASVVQTVLINPAYFLTTLLREEKIIYFLHMFAPLAMLPARRWALVLLAIPGFVFSILTTGYPPTISIAFQYTCHSIPYIFAASVLSLRVLGRGVLGVVKRRAVLTAIAVGVLSHSYVFGAVLQHETFIGGFSKVEFVMTPAEKKRYETLKRMVKMIPQSASVSATENEVPHVAVRLDTYTLKDGAFDADYLLIRAGGGVSGATLNELLAGNRYGLVTQGDGLYLFKRGHESPETAAALSALGVRTGRKK
jgi:uncharacterized membrane protein